MSVIKQLATYDGSAWTIDDIGANASNVSLTTNVAGSNNVQSALSNLCGTSKLSSSRAIVTNSSGVLIASSVTSTELGYLRGATSNIQTQINKLNNNLEDIQEFFDRNDNPTSTNYLFLKNNNIDLSKNNNNVVSQKNIGTILLDSKDTHLSAFYTAAAETGNTYSAFYVKNFDTSNTQTGHGEIRISVTKSGDTFSNITADTFNVNSNRIFKTANFSKTISSIAASGWSTAQTISFTVPEGFIALPGVCSCNNGYVILYNNSWGKGASSASFSLHNISSSAASNITVYARVIFVNQACI